MTPGNVRVARLRWLEARGRRALGFIGRFVGRARAAAGRDAFYVTTISALAFALILQSWPLWEDQSIYHYMAWAVRHQLVLYRDVINMNWPGCILVHVVGQMLTGMNPSGVRLVEAVGLWGLSLATSAVLERQRVSTPIRIATVTCFWIAYLSGGNAQTAQRESFMTPCLAVALAPWLTAGEARAIKSPTAWYVAGCFAAFGASIKPTLCLPLAGVALLTVATTGRAEQRRLWASIGAHAAGVIAMTVGMLAFLALYGDLRGFYRWGIQFTFGPYARLRHSNAVQIDHALAILRLPQVAPTLKLCLFGLVVFAGIVAASALWMRRAQRRASEELARDGARVAKAVVVVSLVALTIHIQGKTHCRYHFIPLLWSLALLGGTLGGGGIGRRLRAALAGFGRHAVVGAVSSGGPLRVRARPLRATITAGSFVVGVAMFGSYVRLLATGDQPDARQRLGAQLAESLHPGETMIMFGFAPSLLCAAQVKTPMPFVDSWIMYASTPARSSYRDEIVRRWEVAMRDPHVRYFIVEPELILGPGTRFDPAVEERARVIVAEHFPEPKLAALGFTPWQNRNIAGLTVYERKP